MQALLVTLQESRERRISAVFRRCLGFGESSLCITVTWLPGSDIPALAAHLTVSDDLAAAAKKGKAAASRFPDAKIALQGRMAAWRSHTLTPRMPETGSLILAHKKLECWLEKMRFYNASNALQGKIILSTRYPIVPMGCNASRM